MVFAIIRREKNTTRICSPRQPEAAGVFRKSGSSWKKNYQENFHALRALVKEHPGLLKLSPEDFSLSLNMQNSYSDHPEEPGDTDLPTKPAATSDILCRLSEAILDDLQKQMKPDFPKLTCIP